MKSLIIITILCISGVAIAQTTRYVAPSDHKETPGSDNKGDGSFSAPWKTLQRAINEAKPGDTVYIRGGLYKTDKPTAINPSAYPSALGVSGTREKPIHYFGYPPDIKNRNFPIIDCRQHCDLIQNPHGKVYNSALYLNEVEYIHFKDLVIRNVFQCDDVLNGAITAASCANLTFEHIVMHNIGQRGYWIQGGAWGEHTQDPPPKFDYDSTRFINCDVYELFDTLSSSPGNGADGWKSIHYKGNYVLWEGCRAWNYSDDAYDPSSVDGATRIFKNCWAMASNKYYNPGKGWQTERNAWKIPAVSTTGEEYPEGLLLVTNCLALFSSAGFVEIYNVDQKGRYFNNTSYRNEIGFGSFQLNGCSSVYKNNLVYGSRGTNEAGSATEVWIYSNTKYQESHNTWDKTAGFPNYVMTDSVTVTDADFETTDSLELVALFTAPRNIDGSLPPFPLKLAPDSDLIDAGVDVYLPYNGLAPDIGAYEIGTFNVDYVLPKDGLQYKEGEDVPLNAIVYDRDFEVDSVVFYSKSKQNRLGVALIPNYIFWQSDWKATDPTGQIDLRAVAYSSRGDSATSSRIKITILPSDKSSTSSDVSLSKSLCNVRYYPENPNLFQILLPEITSSTSVNLISLDGRLHQTNRLSANSSPVFDLDLSDFPAGYYILHFINAAGKNICGSESLRLIKSN